MLTSFDLDLIVWQALNASKELKATLKGGIYRQGDRPDDSTQEDIVINTISVTQDTHPQLATSNVNIYVPDRQVRIQGREQYKGNHPRLFELVPLVLGALRGTRVKGLCIIPESQTIIPERDVRQHFCNIRLGWNIQTDKVNNISETSD